MVPIRNRIANIPLSILSPIAAAIGLLSLLVGCDFKTPGIPSWDIEAVVPFSQRVYHMAELVTDSAKFAERGWGIFNGGADSTLKFLYSDTLEPQRLGDKITRRPTNQKVYVNEVGLLHMDAPAPDTAHLPVTVLLGDSIREYRGPIPSRDLSGITLPVNFGEFTWAQVSEGAVLVFIQHNYPFDIENVTIQLTRPNSPAAIGSAVFPNVMHAGTLRLDSLDLAHGRVVDSMSVVISCHLPGTASVVHIRGSESLTIRTVPTAIEADSGLAEFGVQNFQKSDSLASDDVNTLLVGRIKSGWAYLTVYNELPAKTNATTTMLNVYDSLGNNPIWSTILRPSSPDLETSQIDSINLTGHTVIMTPNDQTIHIHNEGLTEDTRTTRFMGQIQQTMWKDRGVRVKYWTGKLAFASFKGILDSVKMDLPEMRTSVDLPQGMEQIDFTEDTLQINLFNNTQVPMRMSLLLEGRNSTSSPPRSDFLTVNTIAMPGPNSIPVPGGDRLISVAPDAIIVTGNGLTGGRFFPETAGDTVNVGENQELDGDFNLNADMKFRMGDMTIFTDPAKLDKGLDYPIQTAVLNIRVVNEIPLGGWVRFLVGRSTSNMDTLAVVPIMRNAIVDNRVAPYDSAFSVQITSDQFDILKKPGVITRQMLELYGTQGDTAWLYGEDSLSVTATARIKYTVDFNK